MGETVCCSVCGEEIGRGPDGYGLTMHSKKHRREFKEIFGRQPDDYDEVRELLGADYDHPTIWECLTDDAQQSLSEAIHPTD